MQFYGYYLEEKTGEGDVEPMVADRPTQHPPPPASPPAIAQDPQRFVKELCRNLNFVWLSF